MATRGRRQWSGSTVSKDVPVVFVAESGIVKVKGQKVSWQMSPDEAEELADFIEYETAEDDAIRESVDALRKGVEYARTPERSR